MLEKVYVLLKFQLEFQSHIRIRHGKKLLMLQVQFKMKIKDFLLKTC